MAFRDGPFETIKVPLVWTAAVVVVVAMVASVLLIVGDRRDGGDAGPYAPVRAGFDTAVGPVGGVLSAPVRWAGALTDGVKGYFFAVSENRRLKAQVAELQAWRDDAIALKNINARYEAMLGLRTEPAVAMVSARSVLDSRGPFANARVMDAGAAQGLRIGNPVINEHGLVGKVIGTSPNVSRMLMVTDVSSRIPVLVGRTDARAILTGDGSGNPRLEFVRVGAAVEAGDRILSSGDGGGFPRGVPVGVAARGVDGTWRVKLFSDRGAIDYVRVLLFQNFDQLVSPESLNTPPLAGLTTAPAPTPAQTAAIEAAAARRAAAVEAAAQRAAAANAARAATIPTPAAAANPSSARPPVPAQTAPAPTAPAPPAGAPR